jgi:ribonucleoside-triphosphate reductase
MEKNSKLTNIEKSIMPYSFQEEFKECLARLEKKYGYEIYNMSGIGKQLDLNNYGKEYFKDKKNTADVSVDSNSNVGLKNVVVWNVESEKPQKLIYSYYRMWKAMKKKYGLEYANLAVEKQISGEIYINDFYSYHSSRFYCYNYSTLDTALNGVPKGIDTEESVPSVYLGTFFEHLQLFCVHAGSSSLGAVGLADLLITVSCYADRILQTHSDQHTPIAEGRKVWKKIQAILENSWGNVSDEKMNELKELINKTKKEDIDLDSEDACWTYIKEKLTNFIYFLNQPNRIVQSLFTNVSVYDDNFLDTLIEHYYIEDKDGNIYRAKKEIVKKIQKVFLDIMNETLDRRLITFPVVTSCSSLDDDRNVLDTKFLKDIIKINKKYCFINMYGGATSTLSSCCRLRSDRSNKYFSTLGSGGVKVGSLGVTTQNLPRLAILSKGDIDKFKELLGENIRLSQRINGTKRSIIKKVIDKKMFPLYNLGYTLLSTQFSTTGIIGLYEALLNLGYEITSKEGMKVAKDICQYINEVNDEMSEELKAPMNVEQIPGENVAVKLAKKDKFLGYNDKFDIYSNQYIPLKKQDVSMLTRIRLVAELDKYMSGGSILHININEDVKDDTTYERLAMDMFKKGVIYFAFNKLLAVCNDCGKVFTTNKETFDKNEVTCPDCKSENTECALRIVGFIRKFSSWSSERQKEGRNRQFYTL